MTLNKPHLIESHSCKTLADTTWEERRKMTAEQLIALMGPLHVSHPEYKGRSFTLLPMPNLAGRQPVISRTDYGFIAEFRRLLRWAMQ